MVAKKILKFIILILALASGALICYQYGKAQSLMESHSEPTLVNPTINSNLPIENLTLLSIHGPVDATIEYGETETATISAPEAYQQFLRVEQNPNALNIQYTIPNMQKQDKDQQSKAQLHITTPNKLKRLYVYKEAKTWINNVVSISHIGAAGTTQIFYQSEAPHITPLSLHMNNTSSIHLESKHLNLTQINANTVSQIYAKGIDSEAINIDAAESCNITVEGNTHFAFISANGNSYVNTDLLKSFQTSVYTRDYANVGIGPTQHLNLYAKGDSKTYRANQEQGQSTSSYMSNRAKLNSLYSLSNSLPAISSIHPQENIKSLRN